MKYTRWDTSGGRVPWESLKEGIIVETLLSAFPINIPLLYAVAFILVIGLEKACIYFLQKRKPPTTTPLPPEGTDTVSVTDE